MSKVAKLPILVSVGTEIKIKSGVVEVKGPKGRLLIDFNQQLVSVGLEEQTLLVRPKEGIAASLMKQAWALAGTTRAILNNALIGVSQGFEKKLELIGVGYRAQIKGKVITLTVGYSHPVEFNLPEGVSAQVPTQTELLLTSSDKQLLGQTAANIRSVRRPEPYKGKGIRYSDEQVKTKEAKKK